jgi:hypothetical protein
VLRRGRQYIFYNKIDPATRLMYDTSVPDYVDTKRWEQAFITSPDPETCVPVALVGSEALKTRADEQQAKIDEFKGWVQVRRC